MLAVVPFRADAHEQELLDWAQSDRAGSEARNLWQVLNSLIARSAQMEGNEFREQVFKIKAKFVDLRSLHQNQSSTPGIKDYGGKNFAPPSPPARTGPTVTGSITSGRDTNIGGVIRNSNQIVRGATGPVNMSMHAGAGGRIENSSQVVHGVSRIVNVSSNTGGDVNANGNDVTVSATVGGDIVNARSVTISPSGTVGGDVTATGSVTNNGVVGGDITCESYSGSGTVGGDVNYR